MYSYSKEIEEKLLAELHNHYNTGISFMRGDIPPMEDYNDIPHDFAASFDESLIRLFSFAVSALNGNCFPCMINDIEERNAFAEKRHDIPIVGVHLPLVAECIGLAQSYAMFDDFFVMNWSVTRYDYEYQSPVINENGGFDIQTAQDKDKMNLGNMIAFLSVKFAILHEIAHHNFNHLSKTKSGRLSAKSDASSVIDGISLQALEIEADSWAAAKLLVNFLDTKASFTRYYSKDINHLDTIKILYLSALIPLLTAYEKITPENMLDVDHPPAFLRYNDVKEIFVKTFGINESCDNKYWNLIKNELLGEYEKYEWMKDDLIGVLEKFDVPWQGVDIIAKVKDDDADYVKCFIANWMNDVFAYIIIRFIEMTGVGYKNTIRQFKDFITKMNELSAEGIKFYNEFYVEVDMEG